MAGDEYVETGTFEARMYQCTGCRYLSPFKTTADNHVRTRCPSARVVSKRVALGHVSDPSARRRVRVEGDLNAVGDHSTVDNSHNVAITINFNVYNGQLAAKGEMHGVLRDEGVLAELDPERPELVPAVVLDHHLGAAAAPERRLQVEGNRVTEVLPNGAAGRPVTRRQFARQYAQRVVETVAHAALCSDAADALRRVEAALAEPRYRIGRAAVSTRDIALRTASASKDVHNLCAEGKSCRKRMMDALDGALDNIGEPAGRRRPPRAAGPAPGIISPMKGAP